MDLNDEQFKAYLDKLSEAISLEVKPEEQYTHADIEESILYQEFGIYDNLPVMVKDTFDNLANFFLSSNKYIKKYTYGEPGKRTYFLFYAEGTVEVYIREHERRGATPNDYSIEDYAKQEEYIGIMLHSNQEKRMENTNPIKSLALVVLDICNHALDVGILLCLPNSMQKEYLRCSVLNNDPTLKPDFSKLIYYKGRESASK